MKYSDLLETILAKLNELKQRPNMIIFLLKYHIFVMSVWGCCNRSKPLYKLLIIDITKETVSPPPYYLMKRYLVNALLLLIVTF